MVNPINTFLRKAGLFCVVIQLCSCPFLLQAQNYHALHGSNFAGSLGVHNNPSSILQTPYRWDLTLFGVQGKTSTNFYEVRKYSILSSPSNSEYFFKSGTFERFIKANANVNLLNGRVALSRTRSIAFGANLKAHASTRSSSYNFFDTLNNVADFLSLNEANQPLSMNMVHSGWVELYGTYAQTLIDNSQYRLNAGITLKLSRGLSGAHARLSNGRFSRVAAPERFRINNAETFYGYSATYDRWVKGNSFTNNVQDFFGYSQGGASFDLGAEFLIKTEAVRAFDDDDDYYDYRWKLGFSLLDAGANQFRYGRESRTTTGINPSVTATSLNQKFDSTINSLAAFNDSLATLVNQSGQLGGIYRIANPTRLVLNADYFIQGNFYVNAELSLNVSSIVKKRWFYVTEMNLITITPRWETRKLGAYLPLTINTSGQFWIGAAVKAGPLVFGLHNLGYVFSQKSIQNGGGYLALIIRPFENMGDKKDKRLDCPPEKLR
jgi:hypothetical protein